MKTAPVQSRVGVVWGLGGSAFIPLSPVSLQTMEWFSSLPLFPSSEIATWILDFLDGFRIPIKCLAQWVVGTATAGAHGDIPLSDSCLPPFTEKITDSLGKGRRGGEK